MIPSTTLVSERHGSEKQVDAEDAEQFAANLDLVRQTVYHILVYE